MPREAPPTTWNDQRTDELAERTEQNFREVHREIRDLRDKVDRRWDIASAAMIAGFVGLIISHFIG